MRLKRESETPTDLGLNICLWCQTLPKALDISKTQHKFEELVKHQKLCINYEQSTIAGLHVNQ